MESNENSIYPINSLFLGMVSLDRNLRPGGHHGPVVRDCYIIECNEGGEGSIVINGREFPISGECCYVLLPGDTIIHRTAKQNGRYGIFCLFGGMMLREVFRSAGITSETPFLPPECFAKVRETLYKMYELSSFKDMGSEYKRTGLLYELVGDMIGTRASASAKTHIRRAVSVLEAFYHTDVSVSDIAAEVGFERSYFSTLFKEETGLSPYEYLTRLRIQKSKALLRDTDLPISECAELVGLDPVNFSRIFKKIEGITPNRFRKRK